MSDVIRLLPDSVANQIAAGEVIQRPASVVKELVENAVDAGATDIQVHIKDAGRTLIQVVDNGRGMSPTDARMAFERHATSKISAAADLFSLHTMGFRGEALPSICAIAQVELCTMQEGAELGTCLQISGSRVESQEPQVCAKGCNFKVKNLFFNTPARRKFLKSDVVETSNVMREFERLALVNNHLRMSLSTGSRTIELRPGSFKQRITELWRNGLDRQLLPIEVDTAVVKISGFVSHPRHARRRGALQFLIVNGRNMRHPYFHKAIVSCYEDIIPHDTQPCYFLKFEVDPSTIDVNIHPTKSEIKFEQESTIRPILEAAVKATIGKFTEAPAIDFTQDVMPLDPARDGDYVPAPSTGIDSGYNPFAVQSDYNPQRRDPFAGGASVFRKEPAAVKNWESLYTSFMSDGAELDVPARPEASGPIPGLQEELPEEKAPCLQIASKYIVTRGREGLCIIDQHRAHVKVLYERYMRRLTPGSDALAMQRLAFPETLELTPSQSLLLESVEDEVARLGFLISREEGDTHWKIESAPASLGGRDASEVLMQIIESVGDDRTKAGAVGEPAAGDILSRVALVMARAAAIRRGRSLSETEMERLLADLFALPDYSYTPAGNPILRNIPADRLDALFA